MKFRRLLELAPLRSRRGTGNPINTRRQDREFIEAIYMNLLGRFPEDTGLEDWGSKLSRGMSYAKMLELVTTSPEFKANLPKLLEKNYKELPFLNSFSQYGEDQILIMHLLNNAMSTPYIVDIGAHSIIGSNSFIFSHHLNWPTLLIEANSQLIPNLKIAFPRDTIILNCAISDVPGEMNFYVSNNDYVSSLSMEQASVWDESVETVNVRVKRIGDVLSENKIPHDFSILTIDIEGYDTRVLEDMLTNTDYRPKFIVTEVTNSPDEKRSSKNDLSSILLNDYEVLERTHANLILRLRT